MDPRQHWTICGRARKSGQLPWRTGTWTKWNVTVVFHVDQVYSQRSDQVFSNGSGPDQTNNKSKKNGSICQKKRSKNTFTFNKQGIGRVVCPWQSNWNRQQQQPRHPHRLEKQCWIKQQQFFIGHRSTRTLVPCFVPLLGVGHESTPGLPGFKPTANDGGLRCFWNVSIALQSCVDGHGFRWETTHQTRSESRTKSIQ